MAITEKKEVKAFYRYPERVALWCESIKLGTSYKNACAVFHVNYQTVLDTLSRGRRDDCDDTELLAFVDMTEAAEKEFEERNLNIIKKAAERGDWKASAWLLERRIFATYAKRDISVDDKSLTKTAKITVEYVDGNSEDAKKRIEEMEKLIDSEA